MEEIYCSDRPENVEIKPMELDASEGEAPVEKTKTRRGQKPRPIEVLDNLEENEMTLVELQEYVKFLRRDNHHFRTQLKTLKDSFTGIQKQKQEFEDNYNELVIAAKTQIQFCKDTIAQAYKTLAYMQPLGV